MTTSQYCISQNTLHTESTACQVIDILITHISQLQYSNQNDCWISVLRCVDVVKYKLSTLCYQHYICQLLHKFDLQLQYSKCSIQYWCTSVVRYVTDWWSATLTLCTTDGWCKAQVCTQNVVPSTVALQYSGMLLVDEVQGELVAVIADLVTYAALPRVGWRVEGRVEEEHPSLEEHNVTMLTFKNGTLVHVVVDHIIQWRET